MTYTRGLLDEKTAACIHRALGICVLLQECEGDRQFGYICRLVVTGLNPCLCKRKWVNFPPMCLQDERNCNQSHPVVAGVGGTCSSTIISRQLSSRVLVYGLLALETRSQFVDAELHKESRERYFHMIWIEIAWI